MKASATQHYICGYGSLISHDSRYRFSEIDVAAIPVEVSGWQRSWNMASPGELITCVGAVPSPLCTLNGVLIAIEQIDEKLRKREQNYRFVEIPLADLTFLASHNNGSFNTAKYWICEVALPQASKETHPICQSYVDTCLAGCLEDVNEHYAQRFAERFVRQTQGWDGVWINDRDCPRYPRAANVSKDMQQRIDELLHDLNVLSFRREMS